jgi:hypothetical protein
VTARIRTLVALATLAVVAAACASDGTSTTTPAATTGVDPATFAAQVPSTDLYVGAGQRVQVGIFASSEDQGVLLLTSGSIGLRLSPFEDGPGTAMDGPARYVGAPFTGGSPADPLALTPPSEARGVYQLSEVAFDEAGIWQADVSFELDGQPIELSTQFEVLDRPHLPAPGDEALRTRNLTIDSGAPPGAVDSRAVAEGEIPDPELHTDTIAGAIRRGVPVLVLFATPVYCISQFCGPDADWLAELAAERPGDAAYIHVEIWEEFDTRLNQAPIDWLYRDDDLTEPWLFLIDGDGVIVDRWAPLFDPAEVESALDAVSA